MTRWVIDASVLVKWVLPEPGTEFALRLRETPHQLLAPDLVWSETANVLWKKVQRNELSAEQADQRLRALLAAPITVTRSRTLLPLALEIAVSTARTVYDSLYISLAVRKRCKLVTDDRRLVNAVRPTAYSANICLLEEWESVSGDQVGG